ncbi:MAG: aminotransferase class III-fold pyridoxal phosphate-dependent enzyme [Bacteroidetes bacterium]|nr:aminotransferase class III-fold pyridoxal phosphate-dependent enzyme [Bacteroidota bacterium]
MKLFDVYPLYNITPVKAKGSRLWDKNGEEYLDLYGGHAVISVGHSHPHYVKRLEEQLEQIAFYSNAVKIPQQEELAALLGAISGYTDYQLFLSNSGAEANENALKMASFHTGRKKLIVMKGSFHGRTSLAVAATDNPSIVASMNAVDFIEFIPLNDLEALENAMNEEVAAVMIEGIQGVAGIYTPTAEYLRLVRRLCDANGAVMILDEVQSGYGRSGAFFAHQLSGVKPDIISIAKGMGNGFPVAGTLLSPKFQAKHGLLGTTFGGNYLACAAALAVLEIIREEKLVERAKILGEKLIPELKAIPGVEEVRGTGLMLGIQTPYPAAQIRKMLLSDSKIFTGSASQPNTVRLLPALNVQENELQQFVDGLKKALNKEVRA